MLRRPHQAIRNPHRHHAVAGIFHITFMERKVRARAFMTKLLFASVSAVAISAAAAEAADINVFPPDASHDYSIVTIMGKLEYDVRDIRKFSLMTASLKTSAVKVQLDSPGGSANVGIEIGKIIQQRQWDTVVFKDAVGCASACGLLWLAGHQRFMEIGVRIGFHACGRFDTVGGRHANPECDAKITAYLNQLGLSNDVISYMLKAGAYEMTWLTWKDLRQMGLEVSVFDRSVTTR
jgi:hypothetical protein